MRQQHSDQSVWGALGAVGFRVIMSMVFFLVVTPIGLALRMVGWDPMRRAFRRPTTTWAPYPTDHRGMTHYERGY